MSYYNYYLDFVYCVPGEEWRGGGVEGANRHGAPRQCHACVFLPSALLFHLQKEWFKVVFFWGGKLWVCVCGSGGRGGRSANHLFTFGICIMRQGANGSPDWPETGWQALGF